MTQLGLFGPQSSPAVQQINQYTIAHNQVGGAIEPFIRFCREMLGAREGEVSLSLIIEEAWKKGRNHPYLKAWDSYQKRQQ